MAVEQNIVVDGFDYPAGPPLPRVLNVIRGRIVLALGAAVEAVGVGAAPANATVLLSYEAPAAAVDGGILTAAWDPLTGNLSLFSTNAVDANIVMWALIWA